jgi:hypothetical protein
VLCDVRRDLLRFPYTHCVLECNSWAQRQPLAEERG